MILYLVTSSDYDYALIDSAWATREEAEARIAEALAASKTDDADLTVLHSYNWRVKEVRLGEVLDEVSRFVL